MLGLPLHVIVCVVGAGAVGASLSAIWLGPVAFLIALVLVIVALLVLRLFAEDDVQKFKLFALRIFMRSRARTLRFWSGSVAYAPGQSRRMD